MNRAENMKRIRAQYYDKYDDDTKRAWRSKGGSTNPNRNKFTAESARLAAQKRWHGERETNEEEIPQS